MVYTFMIEGLEQALTAFLPLRPPSEAASLEDPLAHLQRLLPLNGTGEKTAARAIAAFRATGQVNDA